MEPSSLTATLAILPSLLLGGYFYWRYIWFFRNPSRTIPPGENLVSPADGTVVYVKEVRPQEEVIVIKQGVKACVNDIVRGDLASPRILIGIFMSPFNVHYNRVPLSGQVEFIRHYPGPGKNRHMGPMHLRTLLRRQPLYRGSLHIRENERLVTKITGRFKGKPISAYIIQIAGKSVNGIDSYVQEGELVTKGMIFGMIRIGSQVDLVVSRTEGMQVTVRPGEKVRAGKTILIA